MRICPRCDTPIATSEFHCPHCEFEPKVSDGIVMFAPDLAEENDDFPAQSHETLDLAQEQSFWFRERNELIFRFAKKHMPEAKSLFEVGCGTGFVLSRFKKEFPGTRLAGGEIHMSGLRAAKRRLGEGVQLLQIDARKLPFEDEFDIVAAFDVIEHIEEDELVLARLNKALRPGGVIMLSVPQHMWLWSAADDIGHHKRRYARGELTQKVKAAGFDVLEDTSFVTMLLPVMAAQRLVMARSKSYDGSSEFGLPGFVDKLLGMTLSFERKLILLGVRLPAGGSRFVIGRKPAKGA